MAEELLPKPPLDLPLPEKDLPGGKWGLPPGEDYGERERNPNILKSNFFLGFVAISFIAAFLIGGFALGKNQTSKQVAQTLTPTPTATPDPTADWKTYEGNGVSFKYPADWELEEIASKNTVDLRSPLKNFSLSFDSYDLKTQTTKFTCATCIYTTVSTINPTEKSEAYVVINSSMNASDPVQEISISGTKNYDSSQGWPYIATPENLKKLIRWKGEFIGKCNSSGCGLVPITLNEFQNKPEVKTAEQILSTFKFTDSNEISCGDNESVEAETRECPAGYSCLYEGTYPNRTGTCKPN